MAKTESTAVNELIDLVKKRAASPAIDPGADLFGHPARMSSTISPSAGDVAPLPRSRAPQSTATHAAPATVAPQVRMTTAQPPRGTTIPPLPRPSRPSLPPPSRPSVPPPAPMLTRAPTGTLPPPTAPVAAPFEVHKPELVFDPDQTWVGNLADKRTQSANTALAKKLVIPAIACIAAGIGLGFYVTATKHKAKPTAATPPIATQPTPARVAPLPPPTETVLHPMPRSAESDNAGTASAGGAQPEPPTKAEQAAQIASVAAMTQDAPADAVREIQTAKGVVKLTDVRIDSNPAGASVTLVDGGKQFPLGATPLVTSVDAARQYDVVVEIAGRPSQMVHLDPATTSRLEVALGRPAVRRAAPAPAAEAAPVAEAAEDSTANGTLMVSSKPPCEIVIDGKATGLRTPQKAIELAAGRHTIQFKNDEASIDKTVNVTIKGGKPTKLIEDLMAN